MDINKLFEILESGDRASLDDFIAKNNLIIEDGILKHKDFKYVKQQVSFWDKRQLVKKINLNSLYGAILNAGCRFYDHRIGQSTTLTGRSITKHMTEVINDCLDGKKDHLGRSVIYNDTDSAYFSIWPIIKEDVEKGRMEWNRDTCVKLYDSVADAVNDSFPEFMHKSFHVPLENGKIIKGGRELVASSGIFITKKRYGVLIYDLEGERLDLIDAITAKKKGLIHGEGKLKAMGLDLKRSDTPKPVQDLLWNLLEDVLLGHSQEDIKNKIQEFKNNFMNKNPWEKGTPKRVNNITKFGALEEKLGKANMPGHVRAAINWNTLKRMNSDNHSITIVDGMKTIMCKLKPNPMGFTCVAYPIDQNVLPEWFKDLPFDNDLMEETIVDQKIQNLLGVLKWDLKSMTDVKSTFGQLFSFE